MRVQGKSRIRAALVAGLTLLLVSSGLVSAQASNTFDVDGLDLDFDKVMPYASAVPASRSMSWVHLATTSNIANLASPGPVDGVTLFDTMEVLVKDQTNASENGIYVFDSTNGLSRVTVYDQVGEVLQGDHVFVESGNVNEHTGWIQQTDNVVVGTSNIVFASGLTQLDGDTNPDIGENIAPTSAVDYLDVVTVGGQRLDAKITYLSHYGVETQSTPGLLNKVDDADDATGENRYVRTSIEWDSNENAEDRYAEFKIEFFRDLDTSPVAVTLENLELSIYDVDNAQTVEISGEPEYQLAAETLLTVTKNQQTSTLKVTSKDQNSSGSSGAAVSAFSQGRVSFRFDSVSTFTFKLGLPKTETDSGSSFDLDFGSVVSWGNRAIDNPVTTTFANAPLPQAAAPAPYTGPLLQDFSSRTLDPCTPKSITITGTRLSGVTASIQGKSVTVLENTDTKLVLAFPAGLTPGSGVDLDINSSSGRLTFQDAFDIPANTCSLELSKGRWTQLQSDGKTVKMYAKDPVGDGKIQFFVDGKEIAWINAVDLADPKLSFASSNPYLVRSVTLNPGKNRFEIKLDGVRVWRATYVPKA